MRPQIHVSGVSVAIGEHLLSMQQPEPTTPAASTRLADLIEHSTSLEMRLAMSEAVVRSLVGQITELRQRFDELEHRGFWGWVRHWWHQWWQAGE